MPWHNIVLGVLIVLYLVGANVLASRAMKYYKGPKRFIWLDVPLDDPELYSEEGKRATRVLHLYYVVAGLALLATIIGIDWLLSRT